jgi:hypothetical protein
LLGHFVKYISITIAVSSRCKKDGLGITGRQLVLLRREELNTGVEGEESQ